MMHSILDSEELKAFYIEGIGDNVPYINERAHRRSLGLMLDSRLRGIAAHLGMDVSSKYAPFDAVWDEGAGETYVDFKLVGEAKRSDYAGFTLNMHFSDHEYQFAKDNPSMVFMAYRIIPRTNIAEHLITFHFHEAKERGLIQLQTEGDEIWWSVDLLQVDPKLGSRLGLSV